MSQPESDRLLKLRALLQVEPDDGFVLYGLAQECQKLGRLDEAIGFYDRAIEAEVALDMIAEGVNASVNLKRGRRRVRLIVLEPRPPRAVLRLGSL